WTPYNPSVRFMARIARTENKPEYFGVTMPDDILDKIEPLIEKVGTNLITIMETYKLVEKRIMQNQNLLSVRFLVNRDMGNKPVMRFSGNNKFYTVFINPSVLIPKRIH